MADLHKLRDRAAGLLGKGKLEKAAGIFQEIVAADPKDMAARQKLAEVLRRLGRDEEAVAKYCEIADLHARQGDLLKAIAVLKIILDIDPGHVETQTALAALYARRAQTDAAGHRPAAGPVPPPAELEDLVVPSEVTGPFVIESLAGGPREAAREPTAGGSGSLPLRSAGAELTPEPTPSHALGASVTSYEAILAAAAQASATGAAAREETLRRGEPIEERRPERKPTEKEPVEQVEPEEVEPEIVEGEETWVAREGPQDAPRAYRPPEATAPDPVRTLPQVPLFSDLERGAFVALAERAAVRSMCRNEIILRQGETGTSMFVVVTGRVRVEKSTDRGDVVLLARLGEGAFFGEMAIITGAPRAAAVIAEEDGELLEITADLLRDLCSRHPRVAESLTRFYRRRLLANAMMTSPLFMPFDRRRRQELMGHFLARRMYAGEVILREGLPSDGVYVILSGMVDIRKRSASGQVLAARLGAGDVFGEMSCLRKLPATATVVAIRSGTVLRLPRSQFDRIVTGYPPVLELVSELTDERAQDLEALANS